MDGKVIPYRVTVDGKPPGVDHGHDSDAAGYGKIKSHRLYQLIQIKHPIKDHIFQIEFLETGAEIFAFTFG